MSDRSQPNYAIESMPSKHLCSLILIIDVIIVESGLVVGSVLRTRKYLEASATFIYTGGVIVKIKAYLAQHYSEKAWMGENGGVDQAWIKVYVGPWDIMVPNTQARKRIVPYHDLHHLVSGYNNSRIGEGQVAAWELGTQCLISPLATLLNLFGMATGLLIDHRKVLAAYEHGRQCNNLYRIPIARLMHQDVNSIRKLVNTKTRAPNKKLTYASFGFYAITSLLAFAVVSPFAVLNAELIKRLG